MNMNELKELFLNKLAEEEPSKCKRLSEAIRYALQGKGKRIRPLLVLASALSSERKASHSAIKLAMPAALAVEYIHTYSLIHDDLPCMDDDDYRRGRLSLHRRFDEALAILAADALIADAFYLISKAPLKAPEQCAELALASGRHGLVLGQCEDLNATTKTDEGSWLCIHAGKTARLFEASCVLGALSLGLSAEELKPYRSFGYHFGMAFQLRDDIEDKAGLAKILNEEALAQQLNSHRAAMRDALAYFRAPRLLLELAP